MPKPQPVKDIGLGVVTEPLPRYTLHYPLEDYEIEAAVKDIRAGLKAPGAV